MNAAVLTVVSKNYLPFARTLMRSVERWNPSYRRFVVLTDTVDGFFDPAYEPFTTILSSDLPIYQNRWIYFKYSILELNTAIKPHAMEYLLENCGISHLVYLDPDIKVYHSLDNLLLHLDSNDIVLTPHLLDPIDDGLVPAELDILRSGAYNLGFIGVRRNGNSIALLRWWQSKLLDHCYADFDRGLFTDQRWMDLVPGMFPNVGILRDPGYNVAYWNLKTRHLAKAESVTLTVGNSPLYFFHFSGLNPSCPAELSKHQNRFQLEAIDVVRDLVSDYVSDVFSQGFSRARQWPYRYGTFENGVAIPGKLRRLAAECADLVNRMGDDPFSTEAYGQFVDYWNEFATDPSGKQSCITRLAQNIYNSRPDLQVLAPDIYGKDQLWFLDWFVHNVGREYDLDDTFIGPLAIHRNRLMRPARRMEVGSPNPVASQLAPEPAMGLNIVGYLHAEMGVGEASRSAATAARSAGLAVSLTNFELTQCRQKDMRVGVADNQFLYKVNLFNVNADQTRALFEHLEKRRDGRYNIGYWVWELEDFPDRWRYAFDYYDEIWVPSEFCRASLARKSPIPVIVSPYAIEVELQQGLTRYELGLPANKFIFLSFLDVLSVDRRKNIDGVITAFRKSAVATRGGHLVVKVNNGSLVPQVVQRLSKECSGLEVTIINEIWSRAKVNALLASCDCLVSLHRSEGFGLTIAEAMYLGKPVIVTGYSGNIDFTHYNNAMLVNYSLVPVGEGAEPYDPRSRWAEPDTSHAAEWMDRAHRDGPFHARIAEAGRDYIRRKLSPAVVGNLMKTRLQAILG